MQHDHHRVSESASVILSPVLPTFLTDRDGITRVNPLALPESVAYRYTRDDSHDPVRWHALARVEQRWADTGELFEVVEAEDNLLMTVGATNLWNGFSTAGLGTPFSTTNAQLVVGDGSTGATNADTDLSAAAGTKLNAADTSSASNATPIVVAGSYSPTPLVGQVVVCSAFGGAGAAAINQTFELSAASAASITLLNSAGSGAITVAGGLVKPINKYRQQANASGSAVVTGNAIVYVALFGTTNANFQWLEWSVCLGAAATNKQAAPPSTLGNRAVPVGGLITKTSAATATLTVSLAIS